MRSTYAPLGTRLGSLAACVAIAASNGCKSGTSDSTQWSSKSQSTTRGPAAPAVGDALPTPTTPPPPAAPSSEPIPVGDPAALRTRAISILEELSRNEWAQVRANAIEALRGAPATLDVVAARALVDPNRGVRYTAARTLALSHRCDVVHLAEPLLNDPSDSVRAAAITFLALCGRNPDQSPLARMVMSDDPEVRANAYVALGDIGNKSAVGLIRASLGHGLELVPANRLKIVNLQAAEALALLGDPLEREPIRAALFAPPEQGELTVLACQMVGELRDERSAPLLYRLFEVKEGYVRPPEIRLAAVTALARISAGQLTPQEVERLLVEIRPTIMSPDPGVRAQAATALAAVGGPESVRLIGALLGDAHPVVRAAAAGGVLVLVQP